MWLPGSTGVSERSGRLLVLRGRWDAKGPTRAWECAPGRASRMIPSRLRRWGPYVDPLASGYRRRDPEDAVLHEIVAEHLETFLGELAQEEGPAADVQRRDE